MKKTIFIAILVIAAIAAAELSQASMTVTQDEYLKLSYQPHFVGAGLPSIIILTANTPAENFWWDFKTKKWLASPRCSLGLNIPIDEIVEIRNISCPINFRFVSVSGSWAQIIMIMAYFHLENVSPEHLLLIVPFLDISYEEIYWNGGGKITTTTTCFPKTTTMPSTTTTVRPTTTTTVRHTTTTSCRPTTTTTIRCTTTSAPHTTTIRPTTTTTIRCTTTTSCRPTTTVVPTTTTSVKIPCPIRFEKTGEGEYTLRILVSREQLHYWGQKAKDGGWVDEPAPKKIIFYSDAEDYPIEFSLYYKPDNFLLPTDYEGACYWNGISGHGNHYKIIVPGRSFSTTTSICVIKPPCPLKFEKTGECEYTLTISAPVENLHYWGQEAPDTVWIKKDVPANGKITFANLKIGDAIRCSLYYGTDDYLLPTNYAGDCYWNGQTGGEEGFLFTAN